MESLEDATGNSSVLPTNSIFIPANYFLMILLVIATHCTQHIPDKDLSKFYIAVMWCLTEHLRLEWVSFIGIFRQNLQAHALLPNPTVSEPQAGV